MGQSVEVEAHSQEQVHLFPAQVVLDSSLSAWVLVAVGGRVRVRVQVRAVGQVRARMRVVGILVSLDCLHRLEGFGVRLPLLQLHLGRRCWKWR